MRILIALCVVAMTPALAQKGAPRTGDEALTCEQLQTEIGTAMAAPGSQNAALQQQAGLTAVAATGSAQAVPTAEPAEAPPAEEGKKKGGFFKKFGQAASGLGGALGGSGGRNGAAALGTAQAVGAAAGALGGDAGGDVASVAQAAGALGSDKLATIGAVAQTTGALSSSRGGGSNLGNVAAAAGALQGGRGGLDAAALQVLAAQQGQKTGSAQAPNPIGRAGDLFQLATAKKCAWVPAETGGAQR